MINPYQYQQEQLEQQNFELTEDLIPNEKLEKLSAIAKELSHNNNKSNDSKKNYVRIYIDKRKNFISKTMEKVYPSETNLFTNFNQFNVAMNRKENQDDLILTQKYYKKSSHKFIFYMNFYLKLVEAERKFALRIIPR